MFYFDASVPNARNLLPLAKNALRKLRTIRHPDVLKFIDVVENESTIYIVTERIQPLGAVLSAWGSKAETAREEWLIWGLHRIAVSPYTALWFGFLHNLYDALQISLAFINEGAQSTHGNVRVDSIFISPSGEWKLGGFELLSNPKDDAAVLYVRPPSIYPMFLC